MPYFEVLIKRLKNKIDIHFLKIRSKIKQRIQKMNINQNTTSKKEMENIINLTISENHYIDEEISLFLHKIIFQQLNFQYQNKANTHHEIHLPFQDNHQ